MTTHQPWRRLDMQTRQLSWSTIRSTVATSIAIAYGTSLIVSHSERGGYPQRAIWIVPAGRPRYDGYGDCWHSAHLREPDNHAGHVQLDSDISGDREYGRPGIEPKHTMCRARPSRVPRHLLVPVPNSGTVIGVHGLQGLLQVADGHHPPVAGSGFSVGAGRRALPASPGAGAPRSREAGKIKQRDAW